MSYDLTSVSSGASVQSGESPKSGIRDKFLALKQKAALTSGEPTDPAFANSFGDQLSDLHGRRRWLLEGLARERWEPDLRARIREILRENEGEIHKGRNIQRTATVSHCWMLGYDMARAQPTVVISCNHATILKRIMRAISQHGVLKEAKFLLKGIPFCDLKYRMDAAEENLGNGDHILDVNGETERNAESRPVRFPSSGSSDSKANQTYQALEESRRGESLKGKSKDENGKEHHSRTVPEGSGPTDVMPLHLSTDNLDQDPRQVRFGAEEISIPSSGRLMTLGGFIMVDDVCFGLTTVHAFLDENVDEEFGQRSISVDEGGLHLYDSDWANEDASDGGDGSSDARSQQDMIHEQQLQRTNNRSVADGQQYQSETGELRRITVSSRHFSANGLDWALCELGEWSKYAINGVYLPPELRTDPRSAYLLSKKLKTTPPLGKILVATRRGVVPGYGTGSDSSIKLGNDDDYRHVWSIQLEESLSSGDSGSWVVDAISGDVYGMIVAGSTGLREEYIIPAVDIGQDIRRVLRADVVRLPTWQDVMGPHTDSVARRSEKRALDNDALLWESDDSLDEGLSDENEERYLLAEVLGHSSIDIEAMVKLINDAQIKPKWSRMTLSNGRTIRQAQRAVDRLLTGHRSRRKPANGYEALAKPELEQFKGPRASSVASSSRSEQPQEQGEPEGGVDSGTMPLFEEPPELLDSNPNFRAEKSRRAWRAKRHADRGPKPHHRKHHRNRKSGEGPQKDPVLRASGPIALQSASFQSKFEMDSEDDQSNLEPDIILVKHKGSIYNSKFPAFSIGDGSLLVGHLRQQVARDFGVEDSSRVTLVHKGKSLKVDSRPCCEEGLKMRSEILCVVKRTPSEELEFLANKFRTELVPQGLEFIINPPADADKRDFEYRKISETMLAQILLKSDAVEAEGDENARTLRKDLTTEVTAFLNDLDAAAQKDVPSNWHEKFLSQNETRRPSMTLPGRPTSSRSWNLRRGDSKGEGDIEDNGLD